MMPNSTAMKSGNTIANSHRRNGGIALAEIMQFRVRKSSHEKNMTLVNFLDRE
jgi:hypothetical protein